MDHLIGGSHGSTRPWISAMSGRVHHHFSEELRIREQEAVFRALVPKNFWSKFVQPRGRQKGLFGFWIDRLKGSGKFKRENMVKTINELQTRHAKEIEKTRPMRGGRPA